MTTSDKYMVMAAKILYPLYLEVDRSIVEDLRDRFARALERAALEGAAEEMEVCAKEHCSRCRSPFAILYEEPDGLFMHSSDEMHTLNRGTCDAQPEQRRLKELRARLAELDAEVPNVASRK